MIIYNFSDKIMCISLENELFDMIIHNFSQRYGPGIMICSSVKL